MSRLSGESRAGLDACTALIIGLGGLGSPCALALARAGVGRLILMDDDRVDETNLHRQILYTDADVGRDKLEVAKEALTAQGARRIDVIRGRFLPENAIEVLRGVDVVVEGADNFATKFLAADAAHLAKVPVVHGAAVRWIGTAWAVLPEGRPCYRCLFEDVLVEDDAPNCSTAGVFGPVVGVVGAMMADLALDILLGDDARTGFIHTFEGKTQRLRSVPVSHRAACPLCGDAPSIGDIERSTYLAPRFARGCSQPARSTAPV